MVRSSVILRSKDVAKSKKIPSVIFQNYKVDFIKIGLLSLWTVVHTVTNCIWKSFVYGFEKWLNEKHFYIVFI